MSLFRRCFGWLAFACAISACGCAMFGGDGDEGGIMPGGTSGSDIKRASFDDSGVEEKSFLTWEDLSLDNLEKTAKKLSGQGPNRDLARKEYAAADALYREAAAAEGSARAEKFLAAAEKFELAAERWPKSALQQDALFMAGESYFFSDYYPKANTAYEMLLKEFPNNRYLDTVEQRRFSIARYWLDVTKKEPESWYAFNYFNNDRPWRDTRGNALRVYDKIRTDDPTGKFADDATLAAANEYFQAGKYLRADEYYTDLRQAYPTSEHQFSAHFLGLKTKLMSYLGPNYSTNVLDDAEKLIKQMRRQFPRESDAEKVFLDRASAEVRFKKAEKLSRLAEYYDFRREFGGAAHYYDRIVRDFPDTPIAEKAQKRLGEIQNLPSAPPQYVPWLVDLFPKRDKVQNLVESALIPPEQLQQDLPSPESGQGESAIATQPGGPLR